MNAAIKALIYGGLSVLVLGCSGGGGDNGSQTVVAPPAEIDSANAPKIAGAVTKSAIEGSDLGTFAGMTGGGGAILGGPDGQVFSKIGGIQSTQLQALRDRALAGELQAVIPPETTDCAMGGTVTISGTIANPLTLSGGDTFTLVFAACDDGAGVVNGTYAMRITSFTGDLIGGTFSMAVSVTLTGFQMTADEQIVSVNGEISVSLATNASPTQSVSMSSSSLRVSAGGSSNTLTNYSAVQSIDQFTGAYTLDVSGTLSSSEFSGSVTFATSVDLIGDGTGFAYSGQVRINGAQSATIEIIVLDGQLVRLDIDFDGDGVIDEIVDTTWAELIAQV
jgi:hypothetical protein